MAMLPISQDLKNTVENVLSNGMNLVDLFVNKNYLIDIDECTPVPLSENEKLFSVISLFEIDKIVYNQDENINDKLVSVYSALSNFGSTALLVISSDKDGVRFYLGTRDMARPDVAREILKNSLKGNFPGINLKENDSLQIEALFENRIPNEYSNITVTSVSIVPGVRDEKEKDKFVQGIEKFIDAMSGEDYTAVFISSPLNKYDLETKKRGYEELYSALSQYSQVVMTYGENDSESLAKGISTSFSKAVNEGITDTTGTNRTISRSKGRSSSFGFNIGFFGSGTNQGNSVNWSYGTTTGTSDSHASTHSTTETNTDSQSDTRTSTTGTSSSVQLTRHNKTVEKLLEKIDEQLERIKSCESYGLWDSACYFISPKEEVAVVAANTYKALVAGEKTGVENSFINTWDSTYEHFDKSLVIMDYLRYGIHPQFNYDASFAGKEFEDQKVSAASMISGLELPILMGIPHKSVSGVTSVESTEFGRNVFRKDTEKPSRIIDLGAIYHMGETFQNNRVRLNLDTMSSHCFITGSTGSGKSNTTYKLIDEVTKPENNVRFLVIEPAKGEYKMAFGGMKGINIFTTNPKFYSMLCINPFEFNEEVHVLEHLDRLIEIFSACWPLYAAMPAILKSSFEMAYIRHGWDLNQSIHHDLGNGRFPDFKDVMEILPEIINSSEYSADSKGDYIGSLVTRVGSLTNGLIGQILNGIPIPDEVLFNENTIVDLSRIGSAETKALIMGVLVLKLSEFRQSTSQGTNLPLRHITILEEAHNLLKRTSTEQGQESANVQGKSVEMISNSIAEMRTYGEGFIIVDQSPSSVDISAIKNTNTKIVMRLPEASDCESIGHSIGLNDNQILELSKLDKGVAAIFQNDWLETVLTKIDKCSDRYVADGIGNNDYESQKVMLGCLLEELINEQEDGKYNPIWLKDIINDNSKGVNRTLILKTERVVTDFCNDVKGVNNKKEQNMLSELMYRLVNCGDLFQMYEKELPRGVENSTLLTPEIESKAMFWIERVYRGLEQYCTFMDESVKKKVVHKLIWYRLVHSNEPDRYTVVLYYFRKQIEKSSKKEAM